MKRSLEGSRGGGPSKMPAARVVVSLPEGEWKAETPNLPAVVEPICLRCDACPPPHEVTLGCKSVVSLLKLEVSVAREPVT